MLSDVNQIGSNLIEVTSGDTVLGFVEIVDGVFVALSGERYDRAVEVAQARDLDRAVARLALAA